MSYKRLLIKSVRAGSPLLDMYANTPARRPPQPIARQRARVEKAHMVQDAAPEELWWLDTSWGCGAVTVRAGVIVGGAPIFRRLFGSRLAAIRGSYPTCYRIE